MNFIGLLNGAKKHWFKYLAPDHLRLVHALENEAMLKVSLPKTPKVAYDTRFSLERLRGRQPYSGGWNGPMAWVNRSDGYPTKTVRDEFIEKFNQLFSETETEIVGYPVSGIDGCINSKSFMSLDRNVRLKYPNLETWGADINDLRDLQGLSDLEKIAICWGNTEAKLKSRVNLYSDNWSGKIYWGNSGGSHHTAVLLYLLRKTGMKGFLHVLLIQRLFDFEGLNRLEESFDLYVVRHNRGEYGLLRSLPRDLYNSSPAFWTKMPSQPGLKGHTLLVLSKYTKLYTPLSLWMSECEINGRAIKLSNYVVEQRLNLAVA